MISKPSSSSSSSSDYRTNELNQQEKTPFKWKQHLIWLALTIDQMELDGVPTYLLNPIKEDTRRLELVLGKGRTFADQSNDEWEVVDNGTVKCYR